MSPSTVEAAFSDARSHGLTAAAVEELSGPKLEAYLYPPSPPSCMRPEPDCAAAFDPKDGCYYLDSQVTSYAWHLMTFGGVHPKSQIEISKGIGWDNSRLLWLSLLGPNFEVNAQGAIRAILTTEPVVAAKRQIMLPRALGAEALEKVTCAWTAAGVLGEWEAFMATGVSCGHAQPAYCANKPDGVYCDPILRNGLLPVQGQTKRCRSGALRTDREETPGRTVRDRVRAWRHPRRIPRPRRRAC